MVLFLTNVCIYGNIYSLKEGIGIMKYLTVGTNEIVKDLFREVEDTESSSMKPRGGLWLTKYENEHYNEWVDYLLEDSVAFYYKSKGSSIWEQPCSLVTLRENANILELSDGNTLDSLKRKYYLNDDKFSYQELSHYYDGIFVDMYKLLHDVNDQRLYKFGVNSLILFNLDCIEYYQSGLVLIEPFDFEYNFCEAPIYEIKCDNVKKRILNK